jgi:hypothetical protein
MHGCFVVIFYMMIVFEIIKEQMPLSTINQLSYMKDMVNIIYHEATGLPHGRCRRYFLRLDGRSVLVLKGLESNILNE